MRLPQPTVTELESVGNNYYFQRVIDLQLDKKWDIPRHHLVEWIHHNYQSFFLFNEELTYNDYINLKISQIEQYEEQ